MKKYLLLLPAISLLIVSCSHTMSPKQEEIVLEEDQLSPDDIEQTYVSYQLDTSNVYIVKDNEYSVYFIKMHNREKTEPDAGYVAVCKNNGTGQCSSRMIIVDNDIIKAFTCKENPSDLNGNQITCQIGNFYPNGKKQLLIRQNVNNGNACDAVVNHYCDINPETLELEYRFSLEEMCSLPGKTASNLSCTYLRRVLDRENVKVYACKEKDEAGKPIGTYTIVSNKDGRQQNVNIQKTDGELDNFLITASPDGKICKLLFRHYEGQLSDMEEVMALIQKEK